MVPEQDQSVVLRVPCRAFTGASNGAPAEPGREEEGWIWRRCEERAGGVNHRYSGRDRLFPDRCVAMPLRFSTARRNRASPKSRRCLSRACGLVVWGEARL